VNPDLAAAIPRLVDGGILSVETAAPLLREARGGLVGVRAEVRALLYFGVLLTMAGVGLLVKENLARIGPLAIAAGIALAAAAALAWVVKVAPPFSWQEVAAPNLAFDYVLLLGLLLAAADLAFVEVRFAPLGAFRPWHLLIVAVLAGAAAFRFDSRVVLSLALSTFAAWRGVSLAPAAGRFLDTPNGIGDAAWRWNMIACGVLFAAFGLALARLRRKAHFEPVAVHFGWLLVLVGIGTGIFATGGQATAWGGLLLAVGGGLTWGAFRARRFPLFAYGVLAGYAGLCRLLATVPHAAELGCFWFGISSLLVVGALLVGQIAIKKAPAP
jgi:hypothetical protein